MKAGRLVLGTGAAVFAGIGLACLVWPDELLRTVGVELTSAAARVEIRAFYGGLELGVALFLATCAVREDWVPLGLTALASMLGGMGGVRLLGALVAGGPAWVHLPIALVELGGAALSLWSLRHLRDARSPLWF